MSTVALGADHAGVDLKRSLLTLLGELGYDVIDLGTNSAESVDYPDFGTAVAQAVVSGRATFGVAICGTGIGISIAANKVAGVRAALVHDVTTARLAREHNNANVVCLGARVIGAEVARDAVSTFLATSFAGGERHSRRVTKLDSQPKDPL